MHTVPSGIRVKFLDMRSWVEDKRGVYIKNLPKVLVDSEFMYESISNVLVVWGE